MLLDVVARCCAEFETGQTFSPVQTDATLVAYNSQHCNSRLHVALHRVGFHIDRHSCVARSTGKVSEQNVNETGRMMPLRFYRAFQK